MGEIFPCEPCNSKKDLMYKNSNNPYNRHYISTLSQSQDNNNSQILEQTPNNNLQEENGSNSLRNSEHISIHVNNPSDKKNSNIIPSNKISSLKQSNITKSINSTEAITLGGDNPVSVKVSQIIKNNSSINSSYINYKCVKTFQCHNDTIVCLIELLSGYLATGSYDTTIKIWDLNKVDPINSIQVNGRVFCLLEFMQGILLCGTDNNEIEMWDINESKNTKLFTFQGHLLWVNCLTKCNINYFASGSNDSDIRIWNYSEKIPYNVLSEHEEGVLTLITLKDGKLCSGSADLKIKIWDWENGKCIAN